MRSAVGGAPASTGPARAEGAGGPAAAGLVARTTDGDLTAEVDWKLGCKKKEHQADQAVPVGS